MYLVMKLNKWENMELEPVGRSLPFPVSFAPDDKQVGYCPVFKEYKDALEYAGDPKLVLEVA